MNFSQFDKDKDGYEGILRLISHLSSVLCLHHGLLHVAHVGSHPKRETYSFSQNYLGCGANFKLIWRSVFNPLHCHSAHSSNLRFTHS